jgi:hypothetical protein
MTAITSHRHIRIISWLLTVAMVLPLTPLAMVGASAQPERARTVLLFPVVDEGGSPVPDLSNRTTNALQMAISEMPGLECTEFASTSSMVRRAVAEGRIRAVDTDQTKFDAGRALTIGHALQVDAVVLASIQSYRSTKDPRSVEIILSGQSYSVKKNFDADTDEPVAQPAVDRAFGVVGVSKARAKYSGSEHPLMREAVDDAAYKAAQYLAGKTVNDVQGKPKAGKSGGGATWLIAALAVGLIAVAVGGSGGSHSTPTGVLPPTGLTISPEATGVRLFWNAPNPTTLTVLFYQVDRSVDGSSYQQLAGSFPTAPPVLDANPVSGTHAYRYRVRAKYAEGPVSDYTFAGPVQLTFP